MLQLINCVVERNKLIRAVGHLKRPFRPSSRNIKTAPLYCFLSTLSLLSHGALLSLRHLILPPRHFRHLTTSAAARRGGAGVGVPVPGVRELRRGMAGALPRRPLHLRAARRRLRLLLRRNAARDRAQLRIHLRLLPKPTLQFPFYPRPFSPGAPLPPHETHVLQMLPTLKNHVSLFQRILVVGGAGFHRQPGFNRVDGG